MKLAPGAVAAVTVAGITGARLRIGNDARPLDALARLFPAGIGRILAAQAAA